MGGAGRVNDLPQVSSLQSLQGASTWWVTERSQEGGGPAQGFHAEQFPGAEGRARGQDHMLGPREGSAQRSVGRLCSEHVRFAKVPSLRSERKESEGLGEHLSIKKLDPENREPGETRRTGVRRRSPKEGDEHRGPLLNGSLQRSALLSLGPSC